MYSRFNVRVYGLLIANGSVLVNDEMIRGQPVRKFPGGGLELGEGTIEGLQREFREELGLEIRVQSHFYTTDYFVKSAWDDSQVLSIYYLVAAVPETFTLLNLDPETEQTSWVPLSDIRVEDFTLPIDKTVAGMLTTSGMKY
ncbi:MAG: NUDIX hydrolase [Sphingobacteriales bacterium]|nr:MAG: NUDIX hydrolase [Sphingobacteriales bacterium]